MGRMHRVRDQRGIVVGQGIQEINVAILQLIEVSVENP